MGTTYTRNKKRICKQTEYDKMQPILTKANAPRFILKIILPSITYAMTIWGGCTNKEGFLSLESLHCRAARVIFRLPRDMPSIEVLEEVKWDSLTQIYKIRLAQLAYKVYNNITPASMSHIIEKTANKYKLRNAHKVNVPRFNTYYIIYMKSSCSLQELCYLECNINRT